MAHSDWQAQPPPRQPPPPPQQPAVPANWGTAGVPMVIVAPPAPDNSAAARGVAGWYVLLLMTIAAVVAVYYAYQTWEPNNGLAAQLGKQQASISQDVAIRDYLTRLVNQTEELERTPVTRNVIADPLSPPELINQIAITGKAIEGQVKANISICKKNIGICKERTKAVKCNLSDSWCKEIKDAEAKNSSAKGDYEKAKRNGDSVGMAAAADKMATSDATISSLYCEANAAFETIPAYNCPVASGKVP